MPCAGRPEKRRSRGPSPLLWSGSVDLDSLCVVSSHPVRECARSGAFARPSENIFLGRPTGRGDAVQDHRCGSSVARVQTMPSARYRGPPVTLADMRAQGVRSLWVVCDLCHHEAVVNMDAHGEAVPVPAFGPARSVVAAFCPREHEYPPPVLRRARSLRRRAQLTELGGQGANPSPFRIAARLM